ALLFMILPNSPVHSMLQSESIGKPSLHSRARSSLRAEDRLARADDPSPVVTAADVTATEVALEPPGAITSEASRPVTTRIIPPAARCIATYRPSRMAAHRRADLVRGAPSRFALLVAISPPRVSSTGDPKCRDSEQQADFTGRGVLFRLYQPRSVRIEAP